jgi:hypothetical protein
VERRDRRGGVIACCRREAGNGIPTDVAGGPCAGDAQVLRRQVRKGITQLLSELGQAIYGAHWQAALAGEIAVSDRSMRRWANGTDAIPWGVWHDVYRHLEARVLTLDNWKKELHDRVVIRECEQPPVKKFDSERHWRIEVHDPLDGRHSMKHSEIVQSLTEVRAVMKNHPGMIFRVTMPFGATAAERHEFAQMNIARL